MFDLIKHAFAALLDDVREALRAGIRSVMFMMLSGVLVLVGIVFFSVGVYQSLAEQLEAWQAGGIVGLVLILLAVILALVARSGGGGKSKAKSDPKPRPAEERDRDHEPAADVEDVVGAQLGATSSDLLRRGRPRTLAMVLAACAGALLVSRFGGRSRSGESAEAAEKKRAASKERDGD